MSKIVSLNVFMDEETLKGFKLKCIKEDKPMKSVIIDFCKAYAEDEIVESSGDSQKSEEKTKED